MSMRSIQKALSGLNEQMSALRLILKAHVKAHIRTLEDGRTIWVKDHDTKREGRAATIHERTAVGKHRDGSHYIRATDKEDSGDIQRAILRLGLGGHARYKRTQANHLGQKGGYDHFHFENAAHVKMVHDELKKQKDLPEEMTPNLFEAAGLGPDGFDGGEQQSLGLEEAEAEPAAKPDKAPVPEVAEVQPAAQQAMQQTIEKADALINDDPAQAGRLLREAAAIAREHGISHTTASGKTIDADAMEWRAGELDPQTASDWSRRMSFLYRTKPRKVEQVYGKNHTADQKAQHDQQVKDWNREYRKATKMQKEATERENEAFRQRNQPSEPTPSPEPVQAGPKEGDRNPEGLVFHDGRWHREEEPQAETSPATWDTTRDLGTRIDAGEATADEIREHWERFKRDQDAIKTSLEGMTKPQIIKACKLDPESRLAKGPKKDLIRALMDHMENRHNATGTFSWSPMTETSMDALNRVISAQTDDHIKAHAERVQKAKEEKAARFAHYRKSIDNPETLEEFETRKRFKAPPLTTEQQRRYDDLKAAAGQAERKEQVQAKATVAPVALGEGIAMELKQTKHTKTGEDLHVVTLNQRVERDKYDELNRKAKKLGGWYSSFKGAGAIPGFQFKSEDAARQFMGLGEGQAADTSPALEAKQEEKRERVTNKLQALADSMEESANKVIGADRKVNTARRAAMAGSAIAEAEKQIAMARTLRNLGDAMETGDLQHLTGITSRSQVEQLERCLRQAKRTYQDHRQAAGEQFSYNQLEEMRHAPATVDDVDHAVFPWPVSYLDNLNHLLGDAEKRPGGKQAAAKIRKYAAMHADARGRVVFDTAPMVEAWAKVAAALPTNDYTQKQIKENFLLPGSRLQAAGITNEHELRAALREYLQYKGQKPKPDPVKKAEMALVGTKIPGYFPTPASLASEVVEKADIHPGMSVLEPSAGKGNLIDAIRSQHGAVVNVHAIEPASSLRDILEAKGHCELVGRDIMEHEGHYDRIVMNPPFENRQDVDHVRKAYDLLKPGGKLVAIMSEGPFFGSDKKAQEFRDWMADKGTSEKNPDGSFKTTEAERHTGVATRTVVLVKPEDRPILKAFSFHTAIQQMREAGHRLDRVTT